MEGKILGIPLVLILLVVFIAVLIDVPMVLLHNMTQKQLLNVENTQLNTNLEVGKVLASPTVEPTATPSATPAVKTFRPEVAPRVTTQVK